MSLSRSDRPSNKPTAVLHGLLFRHQPTHIQA
jgi:hypothetical protein